MGCFLCKLHLLFSSITELGTPVSLPVLFFYLRKMNLFCFVLFFFTFSGVLFWVDGNGKRTYKLLSHSNLK